MPAARPTADKRRTFLASLLAAAVLLVPPANARSKEDRPRPDDSSWAFETSDIPVDPAWRFGRLPNGMRYVLRHNALPAGTAMVRFQIRAGSLDEKASERGYAHFVEHMAFNGSTRVPEGQMVPLLERHGLAFGADTNASTGFETTTYKLDLPRTDPELVDIALMLMRETASELTIAQTAIERERGVILSEMRDRNDFNFRDTVESTRFFYPGSRFEERFPIGTAKTLGKADARRLRAFYEREYVPGHATLVIVGDIDVASVEAAIRARFTDWAARKAETQPAAGPVRAKDKARAAIYVDPALSERTTVLRNGAWAYEPDSVAQRQENLLRQFGYAIVNRRLQRLSRQEDPPFRGAGFGTGNVFESGRATRLIVDTVDRKWRKGMIATAREYRRALVYGFTTEEVAEQVANLRSALENAAGAADTIGNAQLTGAALALVNDRIVPATPQSVLDRFKTFAPQITPETVLAAMKRDQLALDDPLIRYRGRSEPAGGTRALRAAWDEAMRAEVAAMSSTDLAGFAYTDFGPAGMVASDTREPRLGIREIRFSNGVMLNLKRTDLEKDRVAVAVSVDGGDALDTRSNPLATEMMPYLDEGGLGKHSRDDLQTILAGRTVSDGYGTGTRSFDAAVVTTPRDLELQLQLLAAYLVDPGYRKEGETQYKHQMNNFFAQLYATPGSALRAELGGIVSDNDPRFTLQNVDAYRRLSFEKLKADISNRFTRGAIEIGLVGDFDEDAAISLVAQSFGALPARESAFRELADQPPRTFTADRRPRVIRHNGPSDQAVVRLSWPTRDDADPVEALELELLERVVRIEMTESIREKLGKAYSPSASSQPSRFWKGYGTFTLSASVDTREVAATRSAMIETIAALRSAPPSDDLVARARQPLLEAYQNGLKANSGWLSLVDRAQTQGDRIDRYLAAVERMKGITPADLQALARRYLDPTRALEVQVLPAKPLIASGGGREARATQ